MCRFTFYLGPPLLLEELVTLPVNSLIRQSSHSREREEPLNGDGFGVAWYAPQVSPQPAAFRSISPAWNNRNLIELARVTRSPCVLAHVRAASPGLPVTETNCHPFTCGRYAFMHNGSLGGFGRIRRAIGASLSDAAFDVIGGTTDSEHLFAMFLDRLRTAAAPGVDGGALLAAALRATLLDAVQLSSACGASEPSYLNVAVSDGSSAAVSRYTTDDPSGADSLYVHTGRRYTCEDGVCRMLEPLSGQETVLVSSERLSDDPGWQSVPVNHIVVVHDGRVTRFEPVGDAPSEPCRA